jgi:hypothetical protein
LRRESKTRYAHQLIALSAVVALHVAIVALMIVSDRTRLGSPMAHPLELIYLPAIVVRDKPPASATPTDKNKRTNRPDAVTTLPSVPPPTSGAITLPGADASVPTIDWALEAQTVASEIAKRSPVPVANDPTPKSAIREPLEHHLGDEFVTAEGDRAVYVTKNCYQVSRTFADAPNGISNGMGTATYCKRSKGWFDKLFDKLPTFHK